MRTSRILHDPAGQAADDASPWPDPTTTFRMGGVLTHPAAALWRTGIVALLFLVSISARPADAQELPPDIQVDRLMVQVDRQIAGEQFAAALRTLDRILELQEEHDLELPEPFWMKRADVAVGAGDYLEAIASATRYLQIAGREGEHYVAALELLDTAVARGCTPEGMTETLASVRACLAAGADPNGAGDVGRTTSEWTRDCWNERYTGGPVDGTAWESGDCSRPGHPGGSWINQPGNLRAANRYPFSVDERDRTIGFRVARVVAGQRMSRPGSGRRTQQGEFK